MLDTRYMISSAAAVRGAMLAHLYSYITQLMTP